MWCCQCHRHRRMCGGYVYSRTDCKHSNLCIFTTPPGFYHTILGTLVLLDMAIDEAAAISPLTCCSAMRLSRGIWLPAHWRYQGLPQDCRTDNCMLSLPPLLEGTPCVAWSVHLHWVHLMTFLTRAENATNCRVHRSNRLHRIGGTEDVPHRLFKRSPCRSVSDSRTRANPEVQGVEYLGDGSVIR